MVKIQLDLTDKLSRYLGIQKEIYGLKNKRETIIKMIEENLSSDKEIMKRLNKISREV